MPDLSAVQWLLAIISALGIGVAKSGFAGVSMIHVLIFAYLFGARNSTGVVSPMLIVGDICAVLAFRQHARWDYIWRMLPPACVGVIAAWALMHRLDERLYKPLIGAIILALSTLQITRMRRPEWFAHIPHAHWFAWSLGLLAADAGGVRARKSTSLLRHEQGRRDVGKEEAIKKQESRRKSSVSTRIGVSRRLRGR